MPIHTSYPLPEADRPLAGPLRRCLRRYQLLLLAVLLSAPTVVLPAAIQVRDDAGVHIQLAQPARRIVSLAPYLTELLFAAGAGEALVGVSEYSDYPEAANSLPRVGGGNGFDLEAIVALHPDLVVAWQSGNPAGQLARLKALGLTVFLSEPRTLADVPATLLRLGELAATRAQATASAARFRRRYRQLAQRYSRRPVVPVFFQIWDRPLMTLNGDHLASDVIHLCGGRNVFAGLPSLAPQVDIEAVLVADPAVIIVAADDDPALLATWQQWPALTAVAQGHVHAIGRDLLVRHSPRVLDGAAQLCEILESVRSEKGM